MLQIFIDLLFFIQERKPIKEPQDIFHFKKDSLSNQSAPVDSIHNQVISDVESENELGNDFQNESEITKEATRSNANQSITSD